jgi:hypothetical protein
MDLGIELLGQTRGISHIERNGDLCTRVCAVRSLALEEGVDFNARDVGGRYADSAIFAAVAV